MRSNRRHVAPTTLNHEGTKVPVLKPYEQLRRSLLSCFLWEDEFYEDGVEIAQRLQDLSRQVTIHQLVDLAIYARKDAKLRHAPLLLLEALTYRSQELSRHDRSLIGQTFAQVIQRADEMAEFLAVYWRKGKHPLSGQTKKGLALAMQNFDEYQLAKYKGDKNEISMRDVPRLVHPMPTDEGLASLWGRLIKGELAVPDTWEVAISAARGDEQKKAEWTRLLNLTLGEGKGGLGYLAVLRNLRNMAKVGVDTDLISQVLRARKGANRVYPFRFVSAMRAAPQFVRALDIAFQETLTDLEGLPGRTAILVDVSQSMDAKLSGKSDLTRRDAGASLGVIFPGNARVFTFSNHLVEVPAFFGLSGIDHILRSQPHHGTDLGGAIHWVNQRAGEFDRLIVISDEESQTEVPQPKVRWSYMINVASTRNGIGYRGNWNHIDGFSENVFKFIAEKEKFDLLYKD